MSEGAPERGGGDRGEEEARGSLDRRRMLKFAAVLDVFRREISSALRRFERGKGKGNGGGEYGLLIDVA
jgi:hypothetical protein